VGHNTRLRPHRLGGHRVQTTEKPEIVEDVLDVWLTQPLDARWMAAFRLVRGGTNRFRVGEVRIYPIEAGNPAGEWSGAWLGLEADAPRRGLTKQIINLARPHLWLQQAEQRVAFRKLFPAQFPDAMTGSAPKSRDTRGRPRVPDETLARAAQLYVEACAAKSHHPVEVVAQQMGEPLVRVRGWIHKARTEVRGLLTQRGQGETGGQLTKRATLILEQQKRNTKKAKKPAPKGKAS
jgi:hypothetical protein